jgi:hypothetical protein
MIIPEDRSIVKHLVARVRRESTLGDSSQCAWLGQCLINGLPAAARCSAAPSYSIAEKRHPNRWDRLGWRWCWVGRGCSSVGGHLPGIGRLPGAGYSCSQGAGERAAPVSSPASKDSDSMCLVSVLMLNTCTVTPLATSSSKTRRGNEVMIPSAVYPMVPHSSVRVAIFACLVMAPCS